MIIGEQKISTNLLDFSYPQIYSTKSAVFSRIPRQVFAPHVDDLNWSKMTCKFSISYLTDLLVTGEIELFNYTDYLPVIGSNETLNDTTLLWQRFTSKEYEIESGKAYSLRIRITSGTGNSFVYVEAASIILT